MVPKKSNKKSAAGPSPDSDILLHETMKILGDYVDLLSVQPKGPRLAGPRVGPSPAGSPRP
jgi:hypothetical protein